MACLRVVTYNIHRGRGLDGRTRPAPHRRRSCARSTPTSSPCRRWCCGADARPRGRTRARYIAEELGLNYQLGENRKLKGAAYGNVALSRFPMSVVTNYDLSVEGYERRGACTPTSA